jgi:hypothetical protein
MGKKGVDAPGRIRGGREKDGGDQRPSTRCSKIALLHY